MPAVENIRKLLERGEIATLFTREELEECDARLSSSLVNIPTYINNKERLPDEVIDVVVKNKMVYNFISENYPETLRPKENVEKVPLLLSCCTYSGENAYPPRHKGLFQQRFITLPPY